MSMASSLRFTAPFLSSLFCGGIPAFCSLLGALSLSLTQQHAARPVLLLLLSEGGRRSQGDIYCQHAAGRGG